MVGGDPHPDRGRALSFGAVADRYDRFRPEPPAALVEDLVGLGPARVVDVGCGTGKAAVPLVARGLSVLGVEPDRRMAAVARAHGVPVEVATFEDWDDRGRRFDLLTCCQAWHWVDRRVGAAKAARLLRPGGALALFGTSFRLEEEVVEAFEAVYRRFAPEVDPPHRPAPDGAARREEASAIEEPIRRERAFGVVETRTYVWERVLGAGEWVGLVGTLSDHRQLGPRRLAELAGRLAATVEGLGGVVRSRHHTRLLLAHRT